MYEIVESIIDHPWISGTGANTTEQQYIFSICGVIIIVVLVVLARWIDRIFFR